MSKAIWTAWEPEKLKRHVRTTTVANMEKACEFVAEEMRQRAPVRSGRLKKAVAWEIEQDGKGNIVGRVGVRHGFWRTHIARFLEFGTRKMRARPWMRPALFDNLQIVERILKKGR